MSSLPWFMYATGPRKRNSLPRFSMMLKLLRPAIRVVVNGMARVSMAKYHHAHRHRHIHTQTPTHSRTHAHIHTHSHTRTHTHTQPHTISAITFADQRLPVDGLQLRQFCRQPRNSLSRYPILCCNYLRLAQACIMAEPRAWCNGKASVWKKHTHVSTRQE